jgi:hypothetical protein
LESRTITIGTILLFIAWVLAQAFFSPPATEDFGIGETVARICLVLFLAGFGLIIIRQLIGFKSRQKKNSERISSLYLKTYGSQIPVDLSLCKISDLTDKIVIEYQTELNGQNKTFETSIAHNDLDKIRQKIISKKNTILYIDTKDINKYYLDTEFLE